MLELRLLLVLAVIAASWALAGTASAAVPGWEQAQPTSTASNSDGLKDLGVGCPSGKKILGAGAAISGAEGQVGLVGAGPDIPIEPGAPGQGGARVAAREDQDGTTSAWSLSAFGICANPLPNYLVRTRRSESNSIPKTAEARCPIGTRLLGGYGSVNGSEQVVLDDVTPGASLSGVRVAAVEAQGGTNDNWSVAAEAVCALPIPGLEVVTKTSVTDSSSTKSVGASCPSGKNVLSAGGDINGGFGQVRMTQLFPLSFFGDGALLAGAEDQDGTASNWSLTAYAVCAPV